MKGKAKLFGAAEALLDSINARLGPADRLEWEHAEQSLRAQLTREIVESAWQMGWSAPLEQVLGEVMNGLPMPA